MRPTKRSIHPRSPDDREHWADQNRRKNGHHERSAELSLATEMALLRRVVSSTASSCRIGAATYDLPRPGRTSGSRFRALQAKRRNKPICHQESPDNTVMIDPNNAVVSPAMPPSRLHAGAFPPDAVSIRIRSPVSSTAPLTKRWYSCLPEARSMCMEFRAPGGVPGADQTGILARV